MKNTDILLHEAQKSNVAHKYAAIIYHRNHIVGIGHNYITNCSTKSRKCVL